MFSSLGHIFAGQPRKAENTDTRQDIKKHDPDHEKRRRKDAEHDGRPENQDLDFAVVSVDALSAFLESFLTSAEDKESSAPAAAAVRTPHAHAPSLSPENAQAINAYKTSTHRAAMTSSAPAPEKTTSALKLQPDEKVLIYKLLENFRILKARNIEVLRIERSDTFLKSLEESVAKALNNPA
jgi:hypothetical protein